MQPEPQRGGATSRLFLPSEAGLHRSSVDAMRVAGDSLEERIGNLGKEIRRAKARRLCLLRFDELLSPSIDPRTEKILASFLRDAAGLTEVDVRLSGREPEAGSLIIKTLWELVESDPRAFRVRPVVDVTGADWGSGFLSEAAALAGSTGLPVFTTRDPPESAGGAAVINLPGISLASRSEDEYLEILGGCIEEAEEKIVGDGSGVETASFCLLGCHEAIINSLGKGIDSATGKVVAYKTLEAAKARLEELSSRSGWEYLLEPCPYPADSGIFAAGDLNIDPEAAHSGSKVPYYTQSTQLPAGHTDDLYDALEHQRKLQSSYDEGEVFQVHVAAPLGSRSQNLLLIKRVFERFELSELALAPRFMGRGKASTGDSGGGAESWGTGWNRVTALGEMSEVEKEEWETRQLYSVTSL